VSAPGIPDRVDFKGPFFETDPSKTFRQNVRIMLTALAAEGEKDVKSQMRSREGSKPRYGRTIDHVRGRVVNLAGRKWALTMVVSIPNVAGSKREAVQLQAIAHGRSQQGRSRGGAYRGPESRWRAFRNTTYRIRSSRTAINANFTKGLG